MIETLDERIERLIDESERRIRKQFIKVLLQFNEELQPLGVDPALIKILWGDPDMPDPEFRQLTVKLESVARKAGEFGPTHRVVEEGEKP